MDSNSKEIFYEETREILDEIEKNLILLENDKNNTEIIDTIFRGLHTIKGSSGMFNLTDISSFTHEVETFFDNVRKGKIIINKEIINIGLSAKDFLQILIFDTDNAKEEDKEIIIKKIKNYINPEKNNTTEIIKDEPKPKKIKLNLLH